ESCNTLRNFSGKLSISLRNRCTSTRSSALLAPSTASLVPATCHAVSRASRRRCPRCRLSASRNAIRFTQARNFPASRSDANFWYARRKASCATSSAYQKFASLREAEKFRAWVNRIAFRLALNRQRGHRRRLARDTVWHVAGTSDAVDGARSAEERVLVQRLRSEIESLPEKFRRVLQLSIVEEMGAADVGAVLGIPAGTVRSRLHTARKLLLEAMK